MDPAAYHHIVDSLRAAGAELVAVSKTQPLEKIRQLYDLGQRDFGENYVQELVEKQKSLPGDIRWHFIGHLQSNKVKHIAPFVALIQSVDSFRLLREIDKQAEKNNRTIECLLQMHIAREETKFGLDPVERNSLLDELESARRQGEMQHIRLAGCMGMASLTAEADTQRREFEGLRAQFMELRERMQEDPIRVLSMGMSGDYPVALKAGSNMIRIGTLIFGDRPNSQK
jgi:pyridoxal phosphate enzyme (YggS family)